jgi:hypothetical protein
MSDALRPDGSLKDADEMEWYNDVDDDIPVSIPASSTPALSSSSSAQSLDNFFPPMLQPRKSQISASRVALVSLRKRQLIPIMPKQVRSGRLEIITGLAVLHAKSSCLTPMRRNSVTVITPTLTAIWPGVTRRMISLEMMRSLTKLKFRKSLTG